MKNLRFVFFILAISIFYQCYNPDKIAKKYKTKDEFKSSISLSKEEYSLDSAIFVNLFRQMINHQVEPYTGQMFDEKTKIIIDSIIYNSGKKYASLFVIMNIFNGSMRFPGDMNINEWHFDGTVHFAEKIHDSIENRYYWKIFDYHGTDHINGETYEEISQIVRMENLVGRSYAAYANNYKSYNVDDYRFWSSKMFKRIQNEGYLNIPDSVMYAPVPPAISSRL